MSEFLAQPFTASEIVVMALATGLILGLAWRGR